MYFHGARFSKQDTRAACIMSGIALSEAFDVFTRSIKFYISNLSDTLQTSVYNVWAAAEAYSAPSIALTSYSHDGLHVFDDFRKVYAWLSHNTEVNDKVASLWDYGYQTTAMANRTVIVDNNTWNNTHIATVGTAMSSPEKAA